MIFLDTNVVSETLRKSPDPAVIAWLVRYDAELALPTVTINAVDGNNVINYAEARASGGVALSGTVTGLAAGATSSSNNFGSYVPGAIAGTVYSDTTAKPGIGGVTVTIGDGAYTAYVTSPVQVSSCP